MSSGDYKLAADGNMYTKGQPTGLTKAFIDYMLSPAVQGTIVPQLYYAPVNK
jgi:phosphate transport system substrate-binding protein